MDGKKRRAFTVRNLDTNEVLEESMLEEYLLEKLAEAKDAADGDGMAFA